MVIWNDRKRNNTKTVCVSVKTLYERYGKNIVNGEIECSPVGQENPTCDYYNLYDRYGQIVCMDGEECEIVDDTNDVLLLNRDGEFDVTFTLTKEEFAVAAFTE